MSVEYIDAIEALKLWVGNEFTERDIEFYEFMKENECPEIFVEYNKRNQGGLMGNSENVDLKKNLVKKEFINNILNIYKNAKVNKKVKGICIIDGEKMNNFGICEKDFPDLIIPSVEGDKEIMIYTH